METKEQLVVKIKEWINLDTELVHLKQQIKTLNTKKKTLTENLVSVMKTNQIDCFDINDGSLIYKKNKIKKPINSKMLLETLKKYYKTDDSTAEELTTHIMNSREEQIKETIKRK